MTEPERKRERKRRLGRFVLLTLLVPLCAAGAIGLNLAYHIYSQNNAVAAMRFPVLAAPHAGQRFLVFAPHCDDETLGTAGLMQQAQAAGCPLHIVIFTNGDGFKASALRQFDKLNVTPADMVRYGTFRQGETRTAISRLGLSPEIVTFLGYPDRGLLPMWTTNWSPQTLYRSGFTRDDHSPYPNAPTLHAPYCGQSVLNDVLKQMQADQPTDIFVTHPSDDHPDHMAASAFVRTAFEWLRAANVPWAKRAHLHYYLVHRGDWPVPQDIHEDNDQYPPAPMTSLDTQWETLPLTLPQTQRKYAAIKRYDSQTALTGRFLYSFARRSELFGTVEDGETKTLTRLPGGALPSGPEAAVWDDLPPVALDPTGDTLLRAFQSGADITRLTACRDDNTVAVRVMMAQSITAHTQITLTLRPLTLHPPRPDSPQPPCLILHTVTSREGISQPLKSVPGSTVVWRGRGVQFSLPLTASPVYWDDPHARLNVAAETRLGRVVIDRTGFRDVACSPPR